jgi:hypothetical protein
MAGMCREYKKFFGKSAKFSRNYLLPRLHPMQCIPVPQVLLESMHTGFLSLRPFGAAAISGMDGAQPVDID